MIYEFSVFIWILFFFICFYCLCRNDEIDEDEEPYIIPEEIQTDEIVIAYAV